MGVLRERFHIQRSVSGCDFHENVEKLHKTYLTGMYLLNYLLLGFRAVLGVVHSTNPLDKLKHLGKSFMSRRLLTSMSFDNKKFTTKHLLGKLLF